MMPRFARLGGSVPSSDAFLFTRVRITAHTTSRGRVAVAPSDLLGDLPVSHHTPVLRDQFKPANSSTNLRGWKATYPFSNYFDPRNNRPLGNSEDTRQWLLQRLSHLYPGLNFSGVRFVWGRFSWSEQGGLVGKEKVGVFRVKLPQ